MANSEHVAILKTGVASWNAWRSANPHLAPSLYGADLTKLELAGANLDNVDLGRTRLARADLSSASLYQAELFSADLRDCLLIEADLRGAKLHDTNISGANLEGAILYRADFIRTSVSRVRFAHSTWSLTTFFDVDLSSAIGLESVQHGGPSCIDALTLFRSGRALPDTFLRDAGIPEVLVDYLPSLLPNGRALQFHSCFISHSHKDEPFCRRLHSRMQQEGLRVWYAPEEMKGGKKLHDQIDEAISVYDKLLVVLSEASMGSEWVATEILKARKRERSDKRQVLFPIRLVSFDTIRAWERFDADSGKDIGSEIREYFIPDFSNWKNHNDFEAAFARLLKDLKASA